MLRTTFSVTAVTLGLFGFASAASAQVCVSVDASKDSLPEVERKTAVTLLGQSLSNYGQTVVASGCTAGYTVYHLRFGHSITVYLTGPGGVRTATVRNLEDVPPLYDQMVRSLLTGQPMANSNDTMTRSNVTSTQAAPPLRVEAESLWYVRLGYGAIPAGSFEGGPGFGFGYRYELDSIGVDVSFLNLIAPPDNGGGGTTGSLIRLMGLYFVNPNSNRTAYLGAGLGWGGTVVEDQSRLYDGSGLQGELSVGYEILRATSIRMFVQADASLPFYTVKTSQFGLTQQDSKWAPSFIVSLGVGWGRNRTITVRTVN